jgi:NAD(P)-dependent dehydrogenase (short-subunit alcohol dehydrogenase family)
MATNPFTDKTALVTGGASGIGAALGRELARNGAEVVLADRQLALAETVAEDIRAHGGRATAAELDVRSLASQRALVERTAARTGGVHYYFNNAGIAVGGEMESYAQRDWDDVIDVNLRGVAYGVQAVYPLMIRQGEGHIVNTASVAGLVGAAGEGSYAATKHAVVGLSKALRIEARRHGVRVSVLCPGAIRTPILTGGAYGRVNYDGITSDQILRTVWEPLRPMDPSEFAQKALRAIARDQAIIVLPQWWKALWYLDRVSPWVAERVWGLFLEHLRKQLLEEGARPVVNND